MSEEKKEGPNKRAKWEADDTNPELSEKLREQLREVKDPEIGMDVIQLGLIRNVKIGPAKAEINMILTSPFCPYAPAMMKMTREKAEKALKRQTKVELGVEVWDPTLMEDGIDDTWGLF